MWEFFNISSKMKARHKFPQRGGLLESRGRNGSSESDQSWSFVMLFGDG
ncbi:unnamed protein product [Prunus armeniaca]|uniref:Uncharacterized protein n=1 Tax=Prunus armeniaca TaxID=36596 RepID=A0A6J5TEZ9_PRUAR|nr:unnamed protein product [Prunus armeniaca]